MSKKQAFDSAMKELRKNGITAKRNVRGCCRGCIDFPELPKGAPIVWHYGGQGNAFTWRDDKPMPTYTPAWETEQPLEQIYLNHSGLVAESGGMTDAGRRVVDTFMEHGFGVKWNGTLSDCVEVIF